MGLITQNCPLLSPSSSLPPLRGSQVDALSESQILSAIDNLFAVYYPAPAIPKSVLYQATTAAFKLPALSRLTSTFPDSGYNSPGYASEDEDDETKDGETGEEDEYDTDLELLRADEFERSFATRWLEKFMTRAADEGDELAGCFLSHETRQSAVEKTADLLTALLNPEESVEELDEGDDEDDVFCRELNFALSEEIIRARPTSSREICIRINDGLAGSRSTDHTDVGVQTWGASIVLCQMMCDSPTRFGLSHQNLGQAPRIVELGAGTGVVSLVLGQLLPCVGIQSPVVVATDYHPAAMSNLRNNIAIAESDGGLMAAGNQVPVHTCVLDWAEPDLLETEPDWPLCGGANANADVLFATDVVYAQEHAKMLYDCASRLLAPHGVFWLLQTVRQNGRFGEYADGVEAVFPSVGSSPESAIGMTLKILETERLEKKSGVGRGDETFYRLFRIG